MSDYWGLHFLVDAAGCDKNLIKNPVNIKAFLSSLVTRIDMKAYGEPVIAHFATHDPSKGGYTAMQMIETSLIDGHFVDETGEAYISVHSCKDFDTSVVENTIRQFFAPSTMKSTLIKRKA
jgi:S-adenosylmethionine/arginine decarboxylase-like enzyme